MVRIQGLTHAGWNVVVMESQTLIWGNADEARCDSCADAMGFRYNSSLRIQSVSLPLSPSTGLI